MEKSKKKKLFLLIIALIIFIGIVIAVVILNNKNNNLNNNNNNNSNPDDPYQIVDGFSCGYKCAYYDLSDNVETEKTINYFNEDINFNIVLVKDDDLEKSSLTISSNEQEIYYIIGRNAIVNYLKIYAYNDYYALVYRTVYTNNNDEITLLFDKTGEYIGIPAQEEFDEINNEVVSLYKVEFEDDKVYAYKRIQTCSDDDSLAGYKYIYELKDNELKFVKKDNLTCKEIN